VEELLFALLVGLWKLIVRAYKGVRAWWQGHKEERDAQPMQRPSAERAPVSAQDLDPYARQRQAVRDQLGVLENEASTQSSSLGRSGANRPLADAMDQMVVRQSLELRQELDRLPADAAGAVDLARLTSAATNLKRTSDTLVWIANQRRLWPWRTASQQPAPLRWWTSPPIVLSCPTAPPSPLWPPGTVWT